MGGAQIKIVDCIFQMASEFPTQTDCFQCPVSMDKRYTEYTPSNWEPGEQKSAGQRDI